MKNAIWKYPLGPGQNIIMMPQGAKALAVQVQDHQPTLWALVEPDAILADHEFHVVATGEEFDASRWRHISTFQLRGGALIFHAFEAA